MGTARYYVYVLARPDGTPFYVGKGQKSRVFCHEDEARSACTCDKCEVIRSIWEQGGQLQRQINFTTSDEQEALAYERALIVQYRPYGLCNRTIALPPKPKKKLVPIAAHIMTDADDLLTAADAAHMLGLTRQRVTALAQAGRIGRQAGRYYVFTHAEIEAYKTTPRNKGGRPKTQGDD